MINTINRMAISLEDIAELSKGVVDIRKRYEPKAIEIINNAIKEIKGYIENGMFVWEKLPTIYLKHPVSNAYKFDDTDVSQYYFEYLEYLFKNKFLEEFGFESYYFFDMFKSNDSVFIDSDRQFFPMLGKSEFHRQKYLSEKELHYFAYHTQKEVTKYLDSLAPKILSKAKKNAYLGVKKTKISLDKLTIQDYDEEDSIPTITLDFLNNYVEENINLYSYITKSKENEWHDEYSLEKFWTPKYHIHLDIP